MYHPECAGRIASSSCESTVNRCCWPGCRGPRLRADLPLCDRHFVHVAQVYVEERGTTGPAFARHIEREEQERREKRRVEAFRAGEVATEHRKQVAARSVVYYVRTGRYIKIGYTADLRARLHSLRLDPADVIVTEPGGRALEAQRHEQFAADRIGRREDFAPSPALLEHIQEMQERQREAEGR